MRTNVINEILSTERDYIKHLSDICEVRPGGGGAGGGAGAGGGRADAWSPGLHQAVPQARRHVQRGAAEDHLREHRGHLPVPEGVRAGPGAEVQQGASPPQRAGRLLPGARERAPRPRRCGPGPASRALPAPQPTGRLCRWVRALLSHHTCPPASPHFSLPWPPHLWMLAPEAGAQATHYSTLPRNFRPHALPSVPTIEHGFRGVCFCGGQTKAEKVP